MNSKISLQDAMFNRRDWIKYGSLLGLTGFVDPNALTAESLRFPAGSVQPDTDLQCSPKRYEMKKSINLWAFPYPAKLTLKECFELAKRAGFDAVEVNYNLEGDLSPQATEKDFGDIRSMAERIGIEISGVCSFLF